MPRRKREGKIPQKTRVCKYGAYNKIIFPRRNGDKFIVTMSTAGIANKTHAFCEAV